MPSLQIASPVAGLLLQLWVSIAAIVLAVGARLDAQVRGDGTEDWRFNVQGWINASSPALSPDSGGNAIYVGVFASNGRGRLVALTPRADRIWSFEAPSPIDSSPAVAPDGTIYVGSVDGTFYALNPGENQTRIKWFVSSAGVTGSPAIGPDGTVYFGSLDGMLHAVSPQGTVRWSFETDDTIWSSPAVGADGTIYVGSDDRHLYAITPTGELKWRFATGDAIFLNSPAIGADGTIYIGSLDQKVYAIAPDGTKRWEFFTNGPIDVSPAIGADGTIYVASRDLNFYALNPGGSDNLRVKWQRRIGVTTVSSPAVRGDGLIIFGADDNTVRALNPVDGRQEWRLVPTTQGGDDYMESSPAIAPDGSIYIGSADGFLYKLNGNGSPLSAASSWPAFRRNAVRSGQGGPVTSRGRFLNLSTRARIGGTETLVVGFFAEGGSRDAYLLRGVGPTLAGFGVGGYMLDPAIQIYDNDPVLIGQNDNWNTIVPGLFPNFGVGDTTAEVGAFPLIEGSKDAAAVLPLPAGPYTAHIMSADGGGGVVLVEAYALPGDGRRLLNLSTRGQVGAAGEDNLFAGFYVDGTTPVRVLLRGVGPGLTQFGVAGALPRPSITLYAQNTDSTRTPLRTNSGWTREGLTYDLRVAAESVAAFALAPGSADAAMVTTLMPGAYTIQISGVDGTTGEALAEIYVLP